MHLIQSFSVHLNRELSSNLLLHLFDIFWNEITVCQVFFLLMLVCWRKTFLIEICFNLHKKTTSISRDVTAFHYTIIRKYCINNFVKQKIRSTQSFSAQSNRQFPSTLLSHLFDFSPNEIALDSFSFFERSCVREKAFLLWDIFY